MERYIQPLFNFLTHTILLPVSICSPHSNGRLGKRTLGENLKTHWEEGPAFIEVCYMTDQLV